MPSPKSPDRRGRRGWKLYEHAADIGVEGAGATPAQAFEQAALALTAIVTELGTVRPSECVRIDCQAPDLELLFYDWLNALVLRMAERDLLFSRYRVRLVGCRLQATAEGEPVDRARHRPAVEVKGATMTDLSVRCAADGSWIARCVVDV